MSTTPDSSEKIKDLFNLKSYVFISPLEAGGAAFNLLNFFIDIKALPEYQAKEFANKIKSSDDAETKSEMIYTTRSIADNFILVAPILLYRLIESYLKEYLNNLYADDLSSTIKYRKQTLIIGEAIMQANITLIKHLYSQSSAKINLETFPNYKIIEELRELNNCLKHNHDFVSPELNGKNNKWIIDELITVDQINDRIVDFDHGVNSFFYALVNAINPHLKK
jgi:hypothetical protein